MGDTGSIQCTGGDDWEKGSCVAASGAKQKAGVIKVKSYTGSYTQEDGQQSCLKACMEQEATGCEVGRRGCYIHTMGVSHGSKKKSDKSLCYPFKGLSTEPSTADCPTETPGPDAPPCSEGLDCVFEEYCCPGTDHCVNTMEGT